MSTRVDLHVHTTLSPCADRGMTPLAVVLRARDEGLSLIALCDHDVVGGAQMWRTQSDGQELAVLDGVEITTLEQVHVLGIFPDFSSARAMALDLGLPIGEELRGPRPEPSLLEAVQSIHRAGGLAIAAHVDRPSSGLIGRMGGVPSGVSLDALELSALGIARADELGLERFGLPVIVGSDAHDLSEIGQAFSCLPLEHPCFEELVIALRERTDRRCDCA